MSELVGTRKATSRKLFGEHQRNSRRRGIPFLFTLEQWVGWWVENLGHNWIEMRGCSRGKFCMSRIGDAGSYEPGNVRCVLHGDNISDAASNDKIAFGRAAGHAVLNDPIAREVYLTTDTIEELKDRYGISASAISDIRAGRTWRRATAGLTRTSLLGRNQWR